MFESWIAEAYAVGEQRHLGRRLERAVEEWLPLVGAARRAELSRSRRP